jgi:hypothetical protein
MIKVAFVVAAILMAGCSQTDREQTREDAKKLGQDLKRDAKKADAVVTQEMKDARAKVQQGAENVKRDIDRKKDTTQR